MVRNLTVKWSGIDKQRINKTEQPDALEYIPAGALLTFVSL
jgi:hypothetical protein